jgi:hypothetical protein
MALGRLSPSEVGRRNLRVAWQKLFFLEKKIESAEFFHQSCRSLGALAFGLGNFWPCGVVESHLRRLGAPLPSMKRFFSSYLLIKDSGKWWFIVSKIFPQLRRISDSLTHLSWEFSNVQPPCPKAIGHCGANMW